MNRKQRRAAGKLAHSGDKHRANALLLQAFNEAVAASQQGRLQQAAASYRSVIAIKPDFAEAHYNLGLVLRKLGQWPDAASRYQEAVALKPDLYDGHVNLGNVLSDMGRADEAIAAYRRAIALNAGDAEVHNSLAIALELANRPEEAAAAARQAIALKPDFPDAVANLTFACLETCDWQDLAANVAKCRQFVISGAGKIEPFAFQLMSSTPEEQLTCARRHAALGAASAERLPTTVPQAKPKLRLGYLSTDFRAHNVSFLVAELLERHDRDRFELSAYSAGADDGSPMRRRVESAFDQFHDIQAMSNAEAARKIRADAIDILVDLTGYTWGGRTAILGARPAPVQVNFLGYLGTLGASCVDYVIADAIAVPPSDQAFYDEKIVHLPNCCQPSDTTRTITEATPSRADAGLPASGFVFCCFNNANKITPAFFAIWMRLLAAVPGGVLWLLDGGAAMRANLGREAAARGVDAGRIVFAPRVPIAAHLARCRLADLFLDTLPVNAHTTMSDALWAGLPVLTCRGDTFAGRIAASQLHAIGLPELVTPSLEAYEATALHLATQPDTLGELRQRIEANRAAAPLFDMARFARGLERAYERMWAVAVSGGKPEPFAV